MTVLSMKRANQRKGGEGGFCFKTVKSEMTVNHFTIPCVLSVKKVTVSLNDYLLSEWVAAVSEEEVQSLERGDSG